MTDVVTESLLGVRWAVECCWCELSATWVLKERLHSLQLKGTCFGEDLLCALSAVSLPKVRLHGTQRLIVCPVAVVLWGIAAYLCGIAAD